MAIDSSVIPNPQIVLDLVKSIETKVRHDESVKTAIGKDWSGDYYSVECNLQKILTKFFDIAVSSKTVSINQCYHSVYTNNSSEGASQARDISEWLKNSGFNTNVAQFQSLNYLNSWVCCATNTPELFFDKTPDPSWGKSIVDTVAENSNSDYKEHVYDSTILASMFMEQTINSVMQNFKSQSVSAKSLTDIKYNQYAPLQSNDAKTLEDAYRILADTVIQYLKDSGLPDARYEIDMNSGRPTFFAA